MFIRCTRACCVSFGFSVKISCVNIENVFLLDRLMNKMFSFRSRPWESFTLDLFQQDKAHPFENKYFWASMRLICLSCGRSKVANPRWHYSKHTISSLF